MNAARQGRDQRFPEALDTPEQRARRQRLVAIIAEKNDVDDERVLSALRETPRHLFVARGLWGEAYADYPLPIGEGQTISQPSMVAIMTDALELDGSERVLEIGTGSGYQAAVLSRLAREVYTIEIVPALGERARARLTELAYANVHVRIGDGYAGWPEQAPFDRVIITAAPPSVPPALLEQLTPRGVLVAPLGPEGDVQTLYRYRKRGSITTRQDLGDVRFVPMRRGDERRGDGQR